MKKFLRPLVVLGGVLLVVYGLAFGAGTTTITEHTSQSVKMVLFDCTVAAAADSVDTTSVAVFDGEILGVSLLPNASHPPSDNYDVYLYDSNGMMLFSATNQDSATNYVYSYGGGGAVHIGSLSSSTLRLVIDNMDSTSCAACAKAKVAVWIR
jgi:uncharacterized protein YcfL